VKSKQSGHVRCSAKIIDREPSHRKNRDMSVTKSFADPELAIWERVFIPEGTKCEPVYSASAALKIRA